MFKRFKWFRHFSLVGMESFAKCKPVPSNQLYFTVLKYSMQFILVSLLFINSVGGVAIVLLNFDPLRRFVTYLFSNLLTPIQLIPIRIIVFWLLGVDFYRTIVTYFLAALIFLVTLNSVLVQLTKHLSETVLQLSKFRIPKLILFMKAANAFRATEVYLKKNEFVYSTAIPIVIFSGSTLFVVTSYSTIKLCGIVFPPEYLIFPTLSIVVIIFVLTVVPEATKVYEESLKFHRSVARLSHSKYAKCVSRSLRIFGLHATFFVMKDSVKSRIIEFQLYYTVNLLISM